MHKFQDMGLLAKRVPLSGASEYAKGDIVINGKYVVEVKCRSSGFKQLYDWIEKDKADILAVKADYKPYLFLLTEEMLKKLIGGFDD